MNIEYVYAKILLLFFIFYFLYYYYYYCYYYYHLRMRYGNVFSHVCLYVSVCLSCPVRALTFECLDLENLFFWLAGTS